MEEMNNQVIENGTEIVEEVVEKLTFKENLGAYVLAGFFAVGVVATGVGLYKGGKWLLNKTKNTDKVGVDETSDEAVVDVEENNIHEVKDDESEEN